MYKSFSVYLETAAKEELDAITQYITEQGAPDAADKLEKRILETIANLPSLPHRMFYNKKHGIRKCNVGDYIIFFKIYENITPKRIAVTQIIHGKRNVRKLVRM